MTKTTRRWRMMLKRGGATLLVLVVAGSIALWLAGCGAVVTPPMNVERPASIYLMDYGRHTTLLLPVIEEADEDAVSGLGLEPAETSSTNDHWIEYAYGEWKWFALDQDAWPRVFPTLLWPTRGTLGRVEWERPPDDIREERWIPEDGLFVIEVETARVAALLERLDERYESEVDTHHYGATHRLHFVHDDDSYHLFHNCNQVTATWLRELGCEVDGLAILADFRVSERDRSGGGESVPSPGS